MTPRRRKTTVRGVTNCPVCGTEFDDQAYQLVIGELGPFDSIECAEEAVRKARREARGELFSDLLEAAEPDEAPAAAGQEGAKLRTPNAPNRPAR